MNAPNIPSARTVLTGAWTDLRSCWRAAVGLQLWFALLNLACLSPLAAWVLDWLVHSSGQAAVSNHDLAGFALSWRGLLFLLAAGMAYGAGLQVEAGGLTLLAAQAGHGRGTRLWEAIRESTTRLPSFLRLSLLQAGVVLSVVAFGAAALALIKSRLLGAQDINFYLAERPPEWRTAVGLAAGVGLLTALLVAWLWIRWIFAVPLLLLQGLAPRGALRASWRQTSGQAWRLARLFALWWLGTAAVWAAVSWAGQRMLRPLWDWAGLDPSRVLPLIALGGVVAVVGAIVWAVITLGVHQFAVTRLMLDRAGERSSSSRPNTRSDSAKRATGLAWAAVALLAGTSGLTGWGLVRNLGLVETVEITAHRGSSAKAPENTLAALRQAIEDGADYAEIDVQTCADGAVVLVHDGDLMRMAGDPRKVDQLTLGDLRQVDIGSRFSSQFAGERVPTLAEAIEVVRGHIKLNIELKFNRPDPQLVPAVIELLRREKFLDQCVVTSLEAAALDDVRRMEGRLRTGLIVTAAVGQVAKVPHEFLSVAVSMATPEFIRRSHRAGKQVHVWTVNEPEAMLRMIEHGADNLITDKPDVLRTVLRERATLSDPEKLALRRRVLFGSGAPVPSPGGTPQ